MPFLKKEPVVIRHKDRLREHGASVISKNSILWELKEPRDKIESKERDIKRD